MRSKNRLAWLICVSITCCAAGHAQPPSNEKKYPNEIYYDFRGKPLPEELSLRPIGSEQFVKSEDEGLRITLPKDRKDLAPVVIGTRSGIKGDFEITLALEILNAEQPKSDFGVGASLFINKVESATEGATLGRLLKPKGQQVIFWDQGFGKQPKEMQYDIDSRPFAENKLRLRMKRTGTQLGYFVAKGLKGDNFDELPAKEFGGGDIRQVVVRITTGRQPVNVDVRLIDLRIQSGAGAVASLPMATPTVEPSRNWLLAALCVAASILSLAVVVLAALLLRNRRAGAEQSGQST